MVCLVAVPDAVAAEGVEKARTAAERTKAASFACASTRNRGIGLVLSEQQRAARRDGMSDGLIRARLVEDQESC